MKTQITLFSLLFLKMFLRYESSSRPKESERRHSVVFEIRLSLAAMCEDMFVVRKEKEVEDWKEEVRRRKRN